MRFETIYCIFSIQSKKQRSHFYTKISKKFMQRKDLLCLHRQSRIFTDAVGK
jgi:hypothetical protein